MKYASHNVNDAVVKILFSTDEGIQSVNTSWPETRGTALYQEIWDNNSNVVQTSLHCQA